MLVRIARIGGLLLVLASMSAPAQAQVVQSLHLSGGLFVPRGYDARAAQDVLVENFQSLDFRKCVAPDRTSCIRREFTTGDLQGEWLVGFGDHVEFGVGVGFYSSGAPTVYLDYTHPDNSEIEQDLSLRVVPITGLVRFLAGRPGTFQPYFGVGIAALNYRYTESGEFVDFKDYSTFKDRYVASGTAVGPLVMAGFRAPINGDIWGFTTEWRYQGGVGTTGGLANGFLADKIDLGGNRIDFGFLVRF